MFKYNSGSFFCMQQETQRFSRRSLINAGIGGIVGFSFGYFYSLRKTSKEEKINLPIIPRFRVQIYSKDWNLENSLTPEENYGFTEFSYSSSSVACIEVHRNGKLVSGFENYPANSGWQKITDSTERGTVKYSFIWRGKNKVETRLDIPVNFFNDSELLTRILSADREVYYVDCGEANFPRRCLVLSNGTVKNNVFIEYWICGPEVLAGITKEDFLEYWNNPGKYKRFDDFIRARKN